MGATWVGIPPGKNSTRRGSAVLSLDQDELGQLLQSPARHGGRDSGGGEAGSSGLESVKPNGCFRLQLLPFARGSWDSSSGAPSGSGCYAVRPGLRSGGEAAPSAERNLPEWPSPALPLQLRGERSRSGGRGPSGVPPPALGDGLGAGRPGPPSPSAAPGAAEPPPLPPASKFGGCEPGAPRDRGAFVSSWLPRARFGGDPWERCRRM